MYPNSFEDYYRELQVHPDADIEIIKRAYKLLCQRWHPDVCSESKEKAHEKMILINNAFEVLSDQDKRAEYDVMYSEYNRRVYVQPTFSDDSNSEDEGYFLSLHNTIYASRVKANRSDV